MSEDYPMTKPGKTILFAFIAGLFLSLAVLAFAPKAQAQVSTISSAAWQEYEYEWTPGVASTVYRGTPPSGASRALYIQNRSSATCYVSFDAQDATSTGGRGYKFAAGDERSFDITDGFVSSMRAACTAALSAGSALFTSWWK